MEKHWKEIFNNPPSNWRDVWQTRKLISRFDTKYQAENYVIKHQNDFKDKLAIDIHPKDGYVVFYL